MKTKSKTLQLIAAGAFGTLLFTSIASAGRGNSRGGHRGGGSHSHDHDGLPRHLVEFDLDEDGVLNEEEQAAADVAAEAAAAARAEAEAARAAARAEARAAREAARAALIAAVDTDGDGILTEAEWDAYKAAQAQARFDEADTDASGDISSEEFAAATGLEGDHLAQVFAHLAGDDGLVTPDEFGQRRGRKAYGGRGHSKGHHRGHSHGTKGDETDGETDEPDAG